MSRAALDARPRLSDDAIRRQLLLDLFAQLTPDTVLLQELGLSRHRARVDVAAVNGVLHGFEIKSDRDSLRRLAAQVEAYSQVLDFCTVVSGPRFLRRVVEETPDWWGVTVASCSADRLELVAVREGRENPAVDVRALVELLWLDEAVEFLAARGADRGFRSKPRAAVWDRVCQVYEPPEVAAYVRARLKARADRQVARPPS